MEQLTCCSEEPPASHSARPDDVGDWLTRVVTWRWSIAAWLIDSVRAGWSGRTSPASYLRTKAKLSHITGFSVGAIPGTLRADGHAGGHAAVALDAGVRRLTPREWERLQGLPDDYTRISWRGRPAAQCPDSPRYKAIGNSMAVNVMRWIGQRIQMTDELCRGRAKPIAAAMT